jgi:hypothetical protein
VKPGQRVMVLMRGPGGEFEIPFDEAIFGGPVRSESRNYWIRREGAEPVIVPEVERFGENTTWFRAACPSLPSRHGTSRQSLLRF